MRATVLLSLLLVIAILLWWTTIKEGFEASPQESIQDRANPLAAANNPVRNAATTIGMSTAAADNLRSMSLTALNAPTITRNADGTGTQGVSPTALSPRIDDENSYLGLVKFCKEAAAAGAPFSDPKFVKNCGVCMSEGTLVTGETFNTPTGVLVYQEDKETAVKNQKLNGYQFPHVVPSVKAATCKGASLGDTADPVLAINQKDYDTFLKRTGCRTTKKLGNGCSICVSSNEYTYVDKDDSRQPLTLFLFGEGQILVSVGGRMLRNEPLALQGSTPLQFELGEQQEGASLQIRIAKTGDFGALSLFGALVGKVPNEKPYRIPLEKFIQKDVASGSFPRTTMAQYFEPVKGYLVKFLPRSSSDKEFAIEGPIPLTFVRSDAIAAYDCMSSPLIGTPESADMFVEDPCLNPKGQGPNNYADKCLRERIITGGCSGTGSWYQNPQTAYRAFAAKAGAGDIGAFSSWIKAQVPESSKDPVLAEQCLGENIRTPCDEFIGTTRVPNQQCLVYLYANESEANVRVGRAYPEATTSFTTLATAQLNNGQRVNTAQFCLPQGNLNPSNGNGLAELQQKAAEGYKGSLGIDAVKKYLSDVYNKAVGDLNANKSDADGGKRTSWEKCFGIPLAEPKLGEVRVNAKGNVSTTRETGSCDTSLPQSVTPAYNKQIGTVYNNGDYVLSFKIHPTGRQGNWASVIRLTTTDNDCCNAGDRMPAIWFGPNNLWLHVRVGDFRDGNWGFDTQTLPMNQTSSFRLECRGSSVICTVNDRVFSFTQPSGRFKGEARVMSGDRHYQPAIATLTELCFIPLN